MRSTENHYITGSFLLGVHIFVQSFVPQCGHNKEVIADENKLDSTLDEIIWNNVISGIKYGVPGFYGSRCANSDCDECCILEYETEKE